MTDIVKKNKKFVIPVADLIREGTILVTKRKPETLPFHERYIRYVHLGIAALDENNEYIVYDLHPEHLNDAGGNLEKRTVLEYMKDKDLIGTYHTNASSERIKAVADKCWGDKYNNYHFNCQKFIDDITLKEIRSDLYSYYSGIFITLAALGIIVIGGAIYMLASGTKKQQ